MDDDYFDRFDQPEHDIERIEEDNDAPVGPDEAEEAVVTTRDVKPKIIVTRPRLKLDDKRLKGPRGLSVLEPVFKKTLLRGQGYERKDLDTVMSLLEHWAHRLFPKMTFDDCLEKIEDLGHKKSVSSYVTLLRNGCAEEPVETGNEDASGDVPIRSRSPSPQPTVDPFDQLLDRPVQSQLTQEQRDRMERNKLLALERRRAKLKAKYEKPAIAPEDNITLSMPSEIPNEITSGDIIYPTNVPSGDIIHPTNIPSEDIIHPTNIPSEDIIHPTNIPSGDIIHPTNIPSEDIIHPTNIPSGDIIHPTNIPSGDIIHPTNIPSKDIIYPTACKDIIHPSVNAIENNILNNRASENINLSQDPESNTDDMQMETDVVSENRNDNKATESLASDIKSTIIEDNSKSTNIDKSKNDVCFDSDSNKEEVNTTMDCGLDISQGSCNGSENNTAK